MTEPTSEPSFVPDPRNTGDRKESRNEDSSKDQIDRDELGDRLLEASIEALGREKQMSDLTARILGELKKDSAQKSSKPKREAPRRQRQLRRRETTSWNYYVLAALAVAIVAIVAIALSQNKLDEPDKTERKPVQTDPVKPEVKEPKNDQKTGSKKGESKKDESKQDLDKDPKPEKDQSSKPEVPVKKPPVDSQQTPAKPPEEKETDSRKDKIEPKQPVPQDLNQPEIPEKTESDVIPNPGESTEVLDLPTLAFLSSKTGDLEFRESETQNWQDYTKSQKLRAGMQLRARKTTDLQWRDGSLLRFQGQIQLTYKAETAGIEIIGTEVFLDRLGNREALLVQMAGQTYQCAESLACFSRKRDRVAVLCLQGRVNCQFNDQSSRVLEAGQEVQVKKGKPARTKKIKGLKRRFKILNRPSNRVVFREAFEDKPEKLTKGSVKAGSAICRGSGASIELDLPNDRSVESGLILRLRLKTTKLSQLTLQIWAPEVKLNYRVIVTKPKWNQQMWIEYPLIDFIQTVDQKSRLKVGTVIRNIQAHIEGPEKCALEIDEIELVRRVRFG